MKLYKVVLHTWDDINFTDEDKVVLKDALKQSLSAHDIRLEDWEIYANKVEFKLWSHKIPKDVVTEVRTKLAQTYKSTHQNCKRLWKTSYYIES